MNLDPLLEKLLEIWNNGLNVIVLTVLFNLCIALAAALKTKTFDLSKLAGFLTEKILPYTIVYVVVQLLGEAVGQAALAPVAWAAIMAALAGDLLDSLVVLGLPLPEGVKTLVVKREK
jgi:hypothetical protein